MKKRYKIALLGCASSCLMSAAYAQDLQISNIDLSDAVCGSEERFATVKITNVSHDRIKIKGAHISIDEGDTFPHDRHATKFYPGSWDKFWKSCFLTDVLKPGHSCLGTVVLNPEELSCANDAHPLVADGEIERTLEIRYSEYTDGKSDHHYEVARASIDSSITLSGAFGQSYALLADYIDVEPDLNENNPGVLTMTSVEGNVSAADFSGDDEDGDLDDIFYNCENQSCGYVPFPKSKDAFADVAQAYDIFRKAVFDYNDTNDCKNATRTIDLQYFARFNEPITPGFYCVLFNDVLPRGGSAGSATTAVYKWNDEFYFTGDEDDVFVFVFPDEPICQNSDDPPKANPEFDECADAPGAALKNTHFNLSFSGDFDLTDGDHDSVVDPKNMFWVLPLNSTVMVDDGTKFAGNIITRGDFIPTANPSLGEPAPYFRGGVYGLTDDLYNSKADDECDDSCHTETHIQTNGFTFDNDFNDN